MAKVKRMTPTQEILGEMFGRYEVVPNPTYPNFSNVRSVVTGRSIRLLEHKHAIAFAKELNAKADR